MLELAGWSLRLGWPGPGGAVGVWGRKPLSRWGARVSRVTGARLVTVEDGFLRSVGPGVLGEAPLSLLIDPIGVHFDAAAPSRLEQILAEAPLDDPALLARAEAGIARLRAQGLSKYNASAPGGGPEPGYVLVIDQTAGDASIPGGMAGPESFRAMLAAARADHPGARIVVKSHPDVATGRRRGHFGPADLAPGEVLWTQPVNPWTLVEGAVAVYAVTSQLGLEAALAGKPVRLFGLPFYAGWGITEDTLTCPRRSRRLTPAQVFAGAWLLAPIYYDPWRDRLCDFETACEVLACLAAARRPAPGIEGEVYLGFHRWKRAQVLRYAPALPRPPVFETDVARGLARAAAERRQVWFWASKFPADSLGRAAAMGVRAGFVEDGFVRSVGLGAALIDAASLVFDTTGIYFDAQGPSGLEALIGGPPGDHVRARALAARIAAAGVTKYNTGAPARLDPPPGVRVVLVPGQVEDDASIRRGTGEIATNLGLLAAARAGNPDAWLVYKPHPDVEAGLRRGAVPPDRLAALADHVARGARADDLIARADEVWTMTSLMGFEALIRGKPVTCLGLPFYAGWGLTRDLGPVSPRRTARPPLEQLIWAALIGYPRYLDPVSRLPCPPELVVERLAAGVSSPGALPRRLLSRLQDRFVARR